MADLSSVTNGLALDRVTQNWRYRDDGARWLSVAFFGYGVEGEWLADWLIEMPNVRIRAVCDIWGYRRKLAKGRLRAHGHPVEVYEDFRELLEREGEGIDAVFVATPDFCHAEHVRAALRAGKHVYCAAPLAHTRADAEEIVRTHAASGLIMQVGYTRRSDPRYRHAIETCIKRECLLGRVTHAQTQWHRSAHPLWRLKEVLNVPPDTLRRYGYASMEEFLHWRWFPAYGAGQLMTLGVYGLDVCLWVWDCAEASVSAIGGSDYYHRAVEEDGLALFEFKTREGQTARASCHVSNTCGHGGFYEEFMGEHGSLRISPIQKRGNEFTRELDDGVPPWGLHERRGELIGPVTSPEITLLDVGPTIPVAVGRIQNDDIYTIPVSGHASGSGFSHVDNFLQAIRSENPSVLACPPAVALRTERAMFAACESLRSRLRVTVHL
jgi:predicted dehydrogenase